MDAAILEGQAHQPATVGPQTFIQEGPLWMQPLTENRATPGPVVFGFLRVTAAAASRRRALSDALAYFCTDHEVTLGGIFTERIDRAASPSAAFTGLLDALSLTGVYGVVLPTHGHLGPAALAARRRQQLQQAGARLMVARLQRRNRLP